MSDMTVAQYLEEKFFAEIEKNKKYAGRFTGFGNLDESKFFCFLPGLYVLGGTPGAGKTTWALQLVCQLSAGVADCEPEVCAFVSYEISRLKLIAKILARETRIEYEKTKRPDAPDDDPLSASAIFCGSRSPEFERAVENCRRKLENLTILEADAGMTIDRLIEKLRVMAASADGKNFVCVVDYLQLIPTDKADKSETSKERLDGVLFKLRKFQQESGATVVVISSFNRSSNVTGNGDMHAFLGSGGIEYGADVCLSLTRADKTKPDEAPKPPPYEVHLKCTKNRHGGLFNEKFSYWAQSDYFCKFEASEVTSAKEKRISK